MTSPLQQIQAFLPISFTLATSGQPNPEEFTAIASAGYSLVINLATPTSSNWNPDENILVESLGMEYVSIPIDWEYPTLSDFEDFANLLDENSERKVWVHCAKNMRVSGMIYLYHRIRKNYIEEVARRYLEQIWQPNEIWQNFIEATLMLYADE
ncbi:protein tyrosine phosphatase family protein [Limnofasciculus baicalensis]|uniref:Protein tyrosine phosphatase family protein n=1 Tax=Limnofasciculus baicalensis BBK-W-15 TaxID=2699891 RepID=A0AAE3H054_9CYAN|nr:protein tyrosine phosphatase family protein [Limnofasciculus baicalensis]MCP2731812.1 protein tyrosine phosphatase family protein [Limnofasciculus baicalensis BBK-W-15]